jgi:hypothetical protein
MTYANPTERTALISGFCALADYLESNPGVPAPSYADVYAFPPDGDCRDMRAEIDAIADLLGTQARETAGGQHYTAARSFGPVCYRATAICKHAPHDTGRR